MPSITVCGAGFWSASLNYDKVIIEDVGCSRSVIYDTKASNCDRSTITSHKYNEEASEHDC